MWKNEASPTVDLCRLHYTVIHCPKKTQNLRKCPKHSYVNGFEFQLIDYSQWISEIIHNGYLYRPLKHKFIM